MTTRSALVGVVLGVVLLGYGVASAAPADRSDGLTFPVHVQSPDQGVFDGSVHVSSFGVAGDKIVARGLLTGTLVDENGVTTAIVRTVSLPLILPGATVRTAESVAAAASCGILHLELGPLDLDLLGLVVHLDKVVLDISAEPGSGNLLGNLLCAITGLLDGTGINLGLLSNLLNQLLALLT
jgi:hypothetical protein